MNGNGLYGNGHVGKPVALAAWDEAHRQLDEVRDRKARACKGPVDVDALDKWLRLEAQAVTRERLAAQAALSETLRADAATALREELLAHYGDLGPQYPLLVERLVQADIRAQACDALGDTLGAEAHRKAADEVRKSVAALQRYTESLKQEVVNRKIKEQVVRVVEVIEAVVLPVAPQLWNDCIAAIAERAPSLE